MALDENKTAEKSISVMLILFLYIQEFDVVLLSHDHYDHMEWQYFMNEFYEKFDNTITDFFDRILLATNIKKRV